MKRRGALRSERSAAPEKWNGKSPGYSRQADQELMRWIEQSCGREITEATGGDRVRGALLAAIAANESGGCRQAYRFAPENYQRLLGLLSGGESKVEGLARGPLEKWLSAAASELQRMELLKKLAGLHGYTLIPGYCAIEWKAPIEALVERERHFSFAARRLERLCRDHHLDPTTQAVEVGRCWNAGHPGGRTRSPLYSWRLRERMRLYLEMEKDRVQGEGVSRPGSP